MKPNKYQHIVNRTEEQATAAGLHVQDWHCEVMFYNGIEPKAYGNIELDVCPACEDERDEVVNVWEVILEPCCLEEGTGDRYYMAACGNIDCGLQGPCANSAKRAAKLWNALPRL